jgi:uncharacterized protein (TIGR03435 family)
MKLLLAVVLFSANCFAQNTIPPINQAAPEMELNQLLQSPPGTEPTLAALHGKAVVLEFWATWCGGCVAAIPHLNELTEQFKDKPVVFLSVSDENAEIVQAFLKKRPMNGWVGIDKDGAAFRRYGIDARPQTILIDAQGILRAGASPDRLDAAMIERLIAGQPIKSDSTAGVPVTKPMELVQGVPPPLLQVLLRPAAPGSISGFAPGAVVRTDGGRIEYHGVTLRTLLFYTEKMREDRIVAPAWFDGSRYDLSTAVPQGAEYDLRLNLMQRTVAAAFQLKMQREMRSVSVYVLGGTPEAKDKMHVSSAKPSPGFRPHPGQFTGLATPVSRLAQVLGSEVDGVEVIDDTSLPVLYDFDLSWQKGDLKSLQTALHDQLGLDLTKETRDREFLVVLSAVEPKTW